MSVCITTSKMFPTLLYYKTDRKSKFFIIRGSMKLAYMLAFLLIEKSFSLIFAKLSKKSYKLCILITFCFASKFNRLISLSPMKRWQLGN